MPVTGPFENRRFLVVTGNAAIPGISNVSSLQWTADVITLTEGGSHISISEPGKINYQPLTIEREVSFDPFFEISSRYICISLVSQWALMSNRSSSNDRNIKRS